MALALLLWDHVVRQVSQPEAELKRAALAPLALKADVSIELGDDHPTDDEPQTDALDIDLVPCRINGAEQLEQLVLVLVLDAAAAISHLDVQDFEVLLDFLLDVDGDLAVLWSELQGVGHQVQEHLLQPHLVRINVRAERLVEESMEVLGNGNVFHLDFLFHDGYDFTHRLTNIEHFKVLGKVLGLRVNDCKVKHVLHKEINQLGRSLHALGTLLDVLLLLGESLLELLDQCSSLLGIVDNL